MSGRLYMPADPNAGGAAGFGAAGGKDVDFPDDATVIAIGPQSDCAVVLVKPSNFNDFFPVSIDCPYVGLPATETSALIHGKPRASDFIAKGPIIVRPYVKASAIDGLNGAQSLDLLFYSQHPNYFAKKRAPIRKRFDGIANGAATPLVWVHGRRHVRIVAQGTANNQFHVQWYQVDRLNVGLTRNVDDPWAIGANGLSIIDYGLGEDGDDTILHIGADLVRVVTPAELSAASYTVEAFD